jgi:phage terminase large subunit
MSEDEYAREMETSFEAAIEGAYYARLLSEAEIGPAQAHRRVPHDPGLEVHAAWDLGIGDSTAIWLAQFVGREIRLIDYIENNGVALDWYAQALASGTPYTYAPLILPHDAQARELGTGKSRVEMLEGMGFKTRIAPRWAEDGIEAVRGCCRGPGSTPTSATSGCRAIRDYREKVDPKRRVSLGPLHDWTSHAADALRYLMTAYATKSRDPEPVLGAL